MLFSPCEHCGHLISERECEESRTFTKKIFDNEMNLCKTCRSSSCSTSLFQRNKGILNESNQRTGFCTSSVFEEQKKTS